MNHILRFFIFGLCFFALLTMNCDCVYCTFCPDCHYCDDDPADSNGEVSAENPDGTDYALKFDGQDDVVIVPDNNAELDYIDDQITIECWVYVHSFANSPPLVSRFDPGSNDFYMLIINEGSERIGFSINGEAVLTGSMDLYNKWTHLAAVSDGFTMYLYVNGNLENGANFVSGSSSIDVNESDLYIGNDSTLIDHPFRGYINEVRIWSYARSQTEIQTNMSTLLSGTEPGLTAYWPIDEGQGQTLTDNAGDNNAFLGSTSDIDGNDPVWTPVGFPPGN